jgi:ABC transport system ATP-binding/permease protein
MDHLKLKADREIPEVCQLIPARWAYEALMTMQDKYNSFQSTDDQLQAQAKQVLVYYDEREAAKAKREELIADSANSAARVAELDAGIQKAQENIDSYERNKTFLDSIVEQHRLLNQDKYGNQEIHRQIMESQDKMKEVVKRSLMTPTDSSAAETTLTPTQITQAQASLGLMEYPMLLPQKRLPLMQSPIPTLFFNALILLVISIAASLLALVMLGFRERILDAVFRFRKLFQTSKKA